MKRRRLLQGLSAAGLIAGLRPPALAVPAPANWRNWSGSQQCQPAAWQVPADTAELQSLLKSAVAPIRCVGAGHSFSALVPTRGTLLSLDRLAGLRDIRDGVARFGAGTRLAQATSALHQAGFALANQPDIDAQTLAGALATGTHGTGAQLGALHADLQALSLVTPQGEPLQCSPTLQPELFAAAQVSLGALGVISEVQLRVRPRQVLKRRVWLMRTEALLAQAPKLAAQHRHFEGYLLPHTGYGAAITHDDVQADPLPRAEAPDEDVLRDLRRLRDWFGRFPKLRRWTAQKLIDPEMHEDAQDWSHRLLSSQRPTRFNESEFHLPRERGLEALAEVLHTLERRNEVFFPIEFRFVAGDTAWLSPFHGRDSFSIAVHAAVDEPWDYLLKDLGPLFRRHQGRPHWGKLHDLDPVELQARYPRWNDFQRIRRELDPQGRLLNPALRRWFGVA